MSTPVTTLMNTDWYALTPRQQRRVWRHTRVSDAERNWLRNNRAADAERRCACGAPGTVRRLTAWPATGRVLPAHWRCVQHAEVPETVPWRDGQPLWRQTADTCSWRRSDIRTHVVTACGCGHHVGRVEAAS